MEIILGLTAAIGWGVADFCARFASRQIGAYRTLMLMQPFGAIAIAFYLWYSGAWHIFSVPGWRPWIFAIIAGLLNTVSSLSLYYAFEIGTMSVAAPVSSAYPALTVTLALLSGERIDAIRAAGLAVIFAGVILAAISFASPATQPANDAEPAPKPAAQTRLVRGAGWAIVAAIGFGLMFWWLGFHVVREIGGPASVFIVRITTSLVLVVAAVPAGREIALPRGKIWLLLATVGLVDTVAFVANNSGMRLGHVSVVTVLSSLYGAVTVLLGAIFIHERIGKSQWSGIVLIFAGIVLVNL
jgi:drug/metabolite transporter (DMT)-like permease